MDSCRRQHHHRGDGATTAVMPAAATSHWTARPTTSSVRSTPTATTSPVDGAGGLVLGNVSAGGNLDVTSTDGDISQSRRQHHHR
ncbi:MAG: hypothetical protein KF778_14960 [Rhodocyclaceae bacterium]|nr:hypothetical protein [Rhodocyclaceae bacterium]